MVLTRREAGCCLVGHNESQATVFSSPGDSDRDCDQQFDALETRAAGHEDQTQQLVALSSVTNATIVSRLVGI